MGIKRTESSPPPRVQRPQYHGHPGPETISIILRSFLATTDVRRWQQYRNAVCDRKCPISARQLCIVDWEAVMGIWMVQHSLRRIFWRPSRYKRNTFHDDVVFTAIGFNSIWFSSSHTSSTSSHTSSKTISVNGWTFKNRTDFSTILLLLGVVNNSKQ